MDRVMVKRWAVRVTRAQVVSQRVSAACLVPCDSCPGGQPKGECCMPRAVLVGQPSQLTDLNTPRLIPRQRQHAPGLAVAGAAAAQGQVAGDARQGQAGVPCVKQAEPAVCAGSQGQADAPRLTASHITAQGHAAHVVLGHLEHQGACMTHAMMARTCMTHVMMTYA